MLGLAAGYPMWSALDRWLEHMPWWQSTLLALLLVAGVGYADVRIDYQISMLLLYLVPVAIAGWYAGRDAGISVALIASMVTLWAALGAQPFQQHYGAVLWTAASRFGAFVIVATLLDQLHVRLRNEQRLARFDALTGALNRRVFLEQLQYSVDLAARERLPFSLAYVDVDDFKHVNDTQGHAGGDRVLTTIAAVLEQYSRRTDLVGRLGGDEFAMLLPGTASSGARNILAKISRGLAEAFENGPAKVGCSIGVVTFSSAPVDAAEAMRAADALMYRVKAAGKDGAAFETLDPRGETRAVLDAG